MFRLILFLTCTIYAQTNLSRSRHEALVSQYRDEANQEVTTVAGKTRFQLNPSWSMGFKGTGEWIRVTGKKGASLHAGHHTEAGHGDHDPGGGSMDMDMVTGASMQAHSHHGSGEGRGEATISLRHDFEGQAPASLSGSLRYSGESDFHSTMATLSGIREFNQRNTALSGFLGTGIDYSIPDEELYGQSTDWPATSTRLAGGVQLGQILSSRIHLGLSYALSFLSGTLENPYRRARIISTLFPESLPNIRLRQVGGSELSAYLGMGLAAFHREGFYFDSWGVSAWIPESALQAELGEHFMLISKHKYYYQLPAEFYQIAYTNLNGWHTGDTRLAHLEGNEFSIGLEYLVPNSSKGAALTLLFSHANLTNLSGGSHGENMTFSLGWRSQ